MGAGTTSRPPRQPLVLLVPGRAAPLGRRGPTRAAATSARGRRGNARALLAGLREADRDRLAAARHLLVAPAAAEGALLPAAHRALDRLAARLAVSSHPCVPPARIVAGTPCRSVIGRVDLSSISCPDRGIPRFGQV